MIMFDSEWISFYLQSLRKFYSSIKIIFISLNQVNNFLARIFANDLDLDFELIALIC
jgi:hypothetical protein